MKIANGNGRKAVTVAHWNLGSTQWKRKVNTIQAEVDLHKPDLIYISEANMYESTPEYETRIVGYKIYKPATVSIHSLARLVLLVRESIEVEVKKDLMDNLVTSIWVKVLGHNSNILIGGIYREHQFLHQQDDSSLQPQEQLRRWNAFLEQIERASTSSNCHIIGDFNLDHIRWATPPQHHIQLVNATKNCLEPLGFSQLIDGVTRSWPGQVDTCIDHIWSNNVEKIISTTNLTKSAGDHNWITANIRLKGKDSKRLETHRRSYVNFNPETYRQMLAEVNWDGLYKLDDIDTANDFPRGKDHNHHGQNLPY